jgi:hypothetical protein
VRHGTQARSRHAIAVNARGRASICASVIPLGLAGEPIQPPCACQRR